jgi:hypothetical protein
MAHNLKYFATTLMLINVIGRPLAMNDRRVIRNLLHVLDVNQNWAASLKWSSFVTLLHKIPLQPVTTKCRAGIVQRIETLLDEVLSGVGKRKVAQLFLPTWVEER